MVGSKEIRGRGERIYLLRMNHEYLHRHRCENLAKNKIRVESICYNKNVFKGNLNKTICTIIFNSFVFSAILYKIKMLANMKKEEQSLVMIMSTMKRTILGTSLHEHIQSNFSICTAEKQGNLRME